MTIKPEIDVVHAIELHNLGLSWREVGIYLAQEIGRQPVFLGSSVYMAVRNFQQKKKPNTTSRRAKA